jgi:4-alpha-glucanotransferase
MPADAGSVSDTPEQDNPRACGVLLHISSLPSRFGIGSLGPEAHAFAETLAAAGLKYWQFLPLTPTSTFIGNSPYSSNSTFAGNPLFISLEILRQEQLLTEAELAGASRRLRENRPGFRPDRTDYNEATSQCAYLLDLAFQRKEPSLDGDRDFEAFVRGNSGWLADFALFTAIKTSLGGAGWTAWPEDLKWRDPEALHKWQAEHKSSVLKHQFIQYLFFRQWQALRERCARLGVGLIGDLPIYVTHDSADVWARPDLFNLDARGEPLTVAGVPPDYFSATGQRWGNPVYNWDRMRKENFSWWIKRLAHNLALADLIRLDHFRGFCAYWEIPADEKTAVKGRWVKAPVREFMLTVKSHFGALPFIAEDLGIITPDVREIMREFELPGMEILQFAFGGKPGEGAYLPFRHRINSVVYTGTHDNATGRQWFAEAPEHEKNNFICYRGQDMDAGCANEVLMRLALDSQAKLAILHMQDILRLDGSARMNKPSSTDGNWEWRVSGMSGWLPEEFWSDRPRPAEPARDAETEPDSPLGKRVQVPVPDIFGHVRFLCSLYGRL